MSRLIFWISGGILAIISGYIIAKKDGGFKNTFSWWVGSIWLCLLTSYAGLIFMWLMYGITLDPNKKIKQLK